MPTPSTRATAAKQSSLLRCMVEQAHDLRHQFTIDTDADDLVQAIICAAPILAAAPGHTSAALAWLTAQLSPWENRALSRAQVLCTQYSVLCTGRPTDAASLFTAHLYEPFLYRYARASRKRHGVFFTPQPIVSYIIEQVDRLLRTECELSGGLATDSAAIIDPACGTGVFLLTTLDYIHRTMTNKWQEEGQRAADIKRQWNAFVPSLLPRLVGIEILPAAALLSKLNIALKLAATGYRFLNSARIKIITGDALSPNLQSEICNLKSKIPVVLGNPPFASLSTTTNDWIARLVRGDDEVRGYARANGQQLKERKTWLHDDYVKFIRLAQWHVEQAGCGIVGFVTNHGYLDNATFRLMRHELLRVFPYIQIVDLHGNRKKHEVAPGGSRDENVFGLDQGVAIGLFCRPPQTLARSASEGIAGCQANYTELWGPRNDKLCALTDATADVASINRRHRLPSLALRASVLYPRAPDWRLIPAAAAKRHPEYDSAWSLAEAMPVNTTAPVTARDHFVVGFTVEELRGRIAEFCDLSIPDDEIRRRYFQWTRSARYQSGDTRGWKLSEARRIVAADGDWQRHIIRCLYRPFDWRFVFWHPAMIDWPRNDVTRHLIRGSLCLLARRQQLPTQPCTFFWIADGLALDGVIRSDNRGSESLFPLYLAGTANFAPAFVEQFETAMQLAWLPLGRGNLAQTFGPEDLLAYIYSLFHASAYRERYADALRRGFPRLLIPRDTASFATLARRGHDLIETHLLRTPVLSTQYSVPSTLAPNPHSALPNPHLPDAVANFRAGGYVALRKWLQPKHRSTADPDYARIANAISRTVEIMRQIERAIAQAGGSKAFSGR